MPRTQLKSALKSILIFFHIYLTKNQLYDRQTELVITQIIRPDSNCIDIGAHKGEVLDQILKAAPEGQFFAFEPLPDLFEGLSRRYANDRRIQLYNIALSNEKGQTAFNYVVSNPAYSGLRKRSYDRKDELDETIQVESGLLDEILPDDIPIDFIKIDVEGAEYLVLQGAEKTISKWTPHIVFEFGLGAANHYKVSPNDMYNYFSTKGMSINTLGGFLKSEPPFSLQEFESQYTQGQNYYFIAYPIAEPSSS